MSKAKVRDIEVFKPDIADFFVLNFEGLTIYCTAIKEGGKEKYDEDI